MQVGNWFRITVDVQEAATYAATMYFTCPNSGTLALTMSDYATGETVDEREVTLPKTTYVTKIVERQKTRRPVMEMHMLLPLLSSRRHDDSSGTHRSTLHSYFHDWAVQEDAFRMDLRPGWSVLTSSYEVVRFDWAMDERGVPIPYRRANKNQKAWGDFVEGYSDHFPVRVMIREVPAARPMAAQL